MRVISGSARGRKLVRIEGRQIRPTSDRTKEAIFNIIGPRIRHARVLDLFAGTGALGIEALSRGADQAVFLDLSCDIIRRNIELCRLGNQAVVIDHDIVNDPFPVMLREQRFNIIFIDPPYGKGYIEKTLQKEGVTRLMTDDCIIIAEQSCKETLQINCPGLDIFRQKKYSKTIISFISSV